jgi:hypothetical protein
MEPVKSAVVVVVTGMLAACRLWTSLKYSKEIFARFSTSTEVDFWNPYMSLSGCVKVVCDEPARPPVWRTVGL